MVQERETSQPLPAHGQREVGQPVVVHRRRGSLSERVDDGNRPFDVVRLIEFSILDQVRHERMQAIDGDELFGKLNGEPKWCVPPLI